MEFPHENNVDLREISRVWANETRDVVNGKTEFIHKTKDFKGCWGALVIGQKRDFKLHNFGLFQSSIGATKHIKFAALDIQLEKKGPAVRSVGSILSSVVIGIVIGVIGASLRSRYSDERRYPARGRKLYTARVIFWSKKRNVNVDVPKCCGSTFQIRSHLLTSFDHYERRVRKNVFGRSGPLTKVCADINNATRLEARVLKAGISHFFQLPQYGLDKQPFAGDPVGKRLAREPTIRCVNVPLRKTKSCTNVCFFTR